MATLSNKSIKGGLPGVVSYINNPEKLTPKDGLARALDYIHGEHSIERLYCQGHNGCSCNPDLAVQQFRASEARYRARKAGAKEAGLTDGKTPTVAEHIFISFPTEENVPYKTQVEIADKLCRSKYLKDFYAVSNRHFNTDNDHTHLLVSNYAKDGSRKLCLTNSKRKELRKELNRICALDYGLSVIDSPELRYKNPDYEAFIRSLVEGGKVNVYAPADYEKPYPKDEFGRWMLQQVRAGRVLVAEGQSKNRPGVSQAQAYKRWIAEQPDFTRAVDKQAAKRKPYVLISDEQAETKAARAYYWDKRYRSSQYPKYYYAVRLYDEDGHRKSTLHLMIELMLVVMDKEYLLWTPTGQDMGDRREKFFASTNWDIQKGYDAMHLQEVHGVRTPAELESRIAQVGTALSEVRQGKAYYTRALELDPCLYNADKVKQLTAQEDSLRKEYHDLKFIESYSTKAQYELERLIMQEQGPRSLDDILAKVQARQTQGGVDFGRNGR